MNPEDSRNVMIVNVQSLSLISFVFLFLFQSLAVRYQFLRSVSFPRPSMGSRLEDTSTSSVFTSPSHTHDTSRVRPAAHNTQHTHTHLSVKCFRSCCEVTSALCLSVCLFHSSPVCLSLRPVALCWRLQWKASWPEDSCAQNACHSWSEPFRWQWWMICAFKPVCQVKSCYLNWLLDQIMSCVQRSF